ncbi:MAG: tyrosine-protein phosphatase [Candidatus Promineifilaceae bacterium]
MDNDARHLNWEGCYNIRDLGGLPLAAGGETRRGVLVRADHLGRLTEAGRGQLIAYGIDHILDLRSHEEAQDAPSAVFDDRIGPDYRNVPLMSENVELWEKLRRARGWAKKYAIVLDESMEQNARALRVIAAADGPLVFHCHSGKDRTGTLAALLLDLAGVDRQAIAADYALTRERLWPLWLKEVAAAGGEEQVKGWKKPETKPETIVATLDHLDRVYGGTAGYLRTAGVTEDEMAAVRAKLIE